MNKVEIANTINLLINKIKKLETVISKKDSEINSLKSEIAMLHNNKMIVKSAEKELQEMINDQKKQLNNL